MEAVAEDSASKLDMQNKLTAYLYKKLEGRKDIVLTKTLLNGVLSIRFAVGSSRTEERHIDVAFQTIIKETRAVIAEITLAT